MKNPPFKVGDKVTITRFEFDYDEDHSGVRTVTDIHPYEHCDSGWNVSVDGGEPCHICGHPHKPLFNYDSNWFTLYKEEK